jgi:hypothetical protein
MFMSLTFPVPFAALTLLALEATTMLKSDLAFAGVLVGPDRAATIGVFEQFTILLERAQDIEGHGYRPPSSVETDLALEINSSFGVALASLYAVELGDRATFSEERFVGGMLAMARNIPALATRIEVVVAGRAQRELSRPLQTSRTHQSVGAPLSEQVGTAGRANHTQAVGRKRGK